MSQKRHSHRLFITCELLCPIHFLLGILGPFAFLGFPWPIFLTLRSHGLLLTPLGFPGPITLSFILRAHGLAINPLTFFSCITLGLLWPILTFLHHTTHRFATSLSLGSFRPICFLKTHLFILWACDPLFLPLGLNGFSIHLLALLCPCC